MSELKKTTGYLFLQESKLARETIGSAARPAIPPAEPFKRYPSAEKVLLPRRWDGERTNIWQVLQHRRSARRYTQGTISLADLALLLWASQGVTAQAGPYYLRTAPSAGALYPIETYVAADRVSGVEPGLFHFDVRGFQLERLESGRVIKRVAAAALDQAFVSSASVVFIWSAVLPRTMSKYGNRGLRYVFMDAGHVCQNLLLAADALGLGACPVGALFDDELNEILGVDGQEETAVYIAPVGTV